MQYIAVWVDLCLNYRLILQIPPTAQISSLLESSNKSQNHIQVVLLGISFWFWSFQGGRHSFPYSWRFLENLPIRKFPQTQRCAGFQWWLARVKLQCCCWSYFCCPSACMWFEHSQHVSLTTVTTEVLASGPGYSHSLRQSLAARSLSDFALWEGSRISWTYSRSETYLPVTASCHPQLQSHIVSYVTSHPPKHALIPQDKCALTSNPKDSCMSNSVVHSNLPSKLTRNLHFRRWSNTNYWKTLLFTIKRPNRDYTTKSFGNTLYFVRKHTHSSGFLHQTNRSLNSLIVQRSLCCMNMCITWGVRTYGLASCVSWFSIVVIVNLLVLHK